MPCQAGALPSPAPVGTVGETETASPVGTAAAPPASPLSDVGDAADGVVVDPAPLDAVVGVVDDDVVVVGADGVVVVAVEGAAAGVTGCAGVVPARGTVGLDPSA